MLVVEGSQLHSHNHITSTSIFWSLFMSQASRIQFFKIPFISHFVLAPPPTHIHICAQSLAMPMSSALKTGTPGLPVSLIKYFVKAPGIY